MSLVESMREFITERLTAAAEEIFRVVEETIAEYEEAIARQRRLLELVWKPEIKLHRIVCTEMGPVERATRWNRDIPVQIQVLTTLGAPTATCL
ncbi:uncharacterized protein LOC144526354 isoform X2 [Sander vitreus]